MHSTSALLDATTPTSRLDITQLFEDGIFAQAGAPERHLKLPRQVTAAVLKVLAEWLADQARVLAQESSLQPLHRQGTKLTPREQEVAYCVARGLTNAQIAQELVIATSTAERHVANMLIKLRMQSRAQIAAWVAGTARQQPISR
jgi:DNA-binding NarL/FixJ family response regulator